MTRQQYQVCIWANLHWKAEAAQAALKGIGAASAPVISWEPFFCHQSPRIGPKVLLPGRSLEARVQTESKDARAIGKAVFCCSFVTNLTREAAR